MTKGKKKNSKYIPSEQQCAFLGKVLIGLAESGSLSQKNGDLLLQLLEDIGRDRTTMETPTPRPLALKWGMSYITLRNGFATLSEMGAVTIHKECSNDSFMNIEVHYNLDGKIRSKR